MRKSVLALCVLVVLAVLLLAIRSNHPRQIAPTETETEIAAQTSSVAEVQAETPAPVASESTNNLVTVDFSGVKPVIK